MNTGNETLWYIEGGMKEGKRINVSIHSSPFIVGRDQACDLTVKAPGISRKHLKLELKRNRLFLRDLDSTNGTYINRTKVNYPIEIQSGDSIHLGTEELRILKQSETAGAVSYKVDHGYESTVLIDIMDPQLDLKNLFVREENEFNALMTSKEVSVVFQPVVSFSDLKTVGYEALGRGGREDLPTSPDRLFDIAEKLGKAKGLSSAFRTEAIKASCSLPGKPLIFVNTHPVEDLRRELKESIVEMRNTAGPWQVVLEIHESAVTNTDLMHELKATLNDFEMYLAYDDFGAGQARWNELVEVPPDYLKFDMQLIRDIHLKPKHKYELIRKLVEICKDQGTCPVAEGIESEGEFLACKHLGFSHGQGWFFGKPASASSFFLRET